jgi:hypothetical protein
MKGRFAGACLDIEMTARKRKTIGPSHVAHRHSKIAGKIISVLLKASVPPLEVEKVANKLATELSQVPKPTGTGQDEQRRHIETLTRKACERLREASISDGDIYEVARGILELVGCSFAKRPDNHRGFWFEAAVDDYLCQTCDADFEHLSDSDD